MIPKAARSFPDAEVTQLTMQKGLASARKHAHLRRFEKPGVPVVSLQSLCRSGKSTHELDKRKETHISRVTAHVADLLRSGGGHRRGVRERVTPKFHALVSNPYLPVLEAVFDRFRIRIAPR